MKKVDAGAPDALEIDSSRRRLVAAALVRDDGDALSLTDEGRALVAAVAVEQFCGEWMQLYDALKQRPLPEG